MRIWILNDQISNHDQNFRIDYVYTSSIKYYIIPKYQEDLTVTMSHVFYNNVDIYKLSLPFLCDKRLTIQN